MRVAVYGAYGYQGRLIVPELIRRGIEPVLIGRNGDRLRAAAEVLDIADADIRVAAIDDSGAMVGACAGLDAVINCAGPFTLSGTGVARAAIAARCHYLDTSGEQLAIHRIYDTLGSDAERAGVTVIPAVTDAGVPGDLVAHQLFDLVGPLDELISAHVLVGGGISRGSYRSFAAISATTQSGGLSFFDGEWVLDEPARRTSIVFPRATTAVPVVKFALQEVVTVPRHVQVRHVQGVGDAELAAQLATELPPGFIENLPEGPDDEARNDQRFAIVLEAVATDGATVRGVIEGSDSYGTTAVIAAEAVRRLGTDGAPAGVLAPAQAFDPKSFLADLQKFGVETDIRR